MGKAIAVIALLLAVPAFAQVGGVGVSRNAGTGNPVLGYNQTQPTHGLTVPSVCAGAPFTTSSQPRSFIVLYSASGQPYYVPAC
jgi:hypothetical protein